MKWVLVFLLFVLLTLQFRLWVGEGSYASVQGLKQEIEQQQTENDGLAARNETLYREVSELKTGQDAVEEIARSELGMVREGETYYLLVDEDDKPGEKDSANEDGVVRKAPL